MEKQAGKNISPPHPTPHPRSPAHLLSVSLTWLVLLSACLFTVHSIEWLSQLLHVPDTVLAGSQFSRLPEMDRNSQIYFLVEGCHQPTWVKHESLVQSTLAREARRIPCYQGHWRVVGVNRESNSQRRVLRTMTKSQKIFAISSCLITICQKVIFVKKKKKTPCIFKYSEGGSLYHKPEA